MHFNIGMSLDDSDDYETDNSGDDSSSDDGEEDDSSGEYETDDGEESGEGLSRSSL